MSLSYNMYVVSMSVSRVPVSPQLQQLERASCVVIVSSDSVNQTLSADWPAAVSSSSRIGRPHRSLSELSTAAIQSCDTTFSAHALINQCSVGLARYTTANVTTAAAVIRLLIAWSSIMPPAAKHQALRRCELRRGSLTLTKKCALSAVGS